MIKNLINSNVYKVIVKPSLNIATAGYFDMIDQLANSILKDRKQEFLNFISENIDLLNDPLIYNDDNFISGVISLYEFTMRQRFEKKRQRGFGIFLGFVSSKDKENFELEIMLNTLNLLSINDMLLCFKIKSWRNYPESILGTHYDGMSIEWRTRTPLETESMWQLVNLGILNEKPNSNASYIISNFGKSFINQLTK